MDAFIAISRNPNPNTLKDSNSSIVLSTSTRSSPFHPHNRLQHHVAVYLSPGHEHHEHNPSASGVAYQANTSRKRKPPSSPEPSQSRPKPTRIPRSVPTANSSARRLPPPSQDVDLLPCPGEVVYHNVKAIKTLCQLPPTCQVSDVKLEPSLNKVAEKEPRFIDRRIIYQAWREFHNQDSQLTFLEAVGRVPDHAPWPGSPRILGNEADAKEAFIVNTLAPILSIVNCFLPEQYRKLLEIQLFSEVSSVDKTRMDIIIMLVDKRKDKDGLRLLKYKKPLVFVEAKRHNLVDGTGWPIIQGCVQRPLKYETGQIRALLPQVFMYADSRQCCRAILTDQSDALLFDINLGDLSNSKRPLRMSYIDVSKTASSKDVFSYGPRLSIAFHVFEALRELGVLDNKLYPHGQPPLDYGLSRYLHPERHLSPSPAPPAPPAKRVPPQTLTTRREPGPRMTRNSMSTGA